MPLGPWFYVLHSFTSLWDYCVKKNTVEAFTELINEKRSYRRLACPVATKAPPYRRMSLLNLNSELSWEGLDPTVSPTDILEVSKCTLQTKQNSFILKKQFSFLCSCPSWLQFFKEHGYANLLKVAHIGVLKWKSSDMTRYKALAFCDF